MRWPFSKKRSDLSPEVEKIFEKLNHYLTDETAQNERYPEILKQQISQKQSVDIVPGATGEFGKCVTNPIPVNGPIGELMYLSALRKYPDDKVIFHRIGSKGAVDIYEIRSLNDDERSHLFLNMYFPKKSSLAPSGYVVRQPDRSDVRFLRGVNTRMENFPDNLYSAAADVANKLFGMSLVDLELKQFDAPHAPAPKVAHIKSMEKVEVPRSMPRVERVRFQWSTMADLENRGDIFVVFSVQSNDSVNLTCEQFLDFAVSYASIEEARYNSPHDLSGHIANLVGGPCSIWTPDEYGSQKR